MYGGAGVHVAELVRALRAVDGVDARVHASAASAPRPAPRRTPTRRASPTGQRRRADPGRRPGDGRRLRRHRPGPLPHLVRQPRRPPGQAAARRPARGLRAQPGADAALEGRAAGRRVRRVELGRADGVRVRRRRDRGQRRDARRRAAHLPRHRPRPRARRPQRHRHRRLAARAEPRPRARARASTPTARASSSSAGSPARRGCRCSCAPPPSSRPTCSWSCAPARPTPPRSRPRSAAWSTPSPPSATAWCGSPRCCPAPTSSPCSPRRPSSPAPRSTSRWASSTSRRWPARPPSSRPRRAGIPEVVVHGETGWLVPIEQATDGTGHAAAPRAVRRRPGRRAGRGGQRPGAGGGVRRGRAPPGTGALQLARDRGADDGDLPLAGLSHRRVVVGPAPGRGPR